MEKTSRTLAVIASLIFLICLFIGFRFSYNKPLWNDEIYAFIENTQKLSYSDIFLSRGIDEGNICPLFFLSQKVICDIFHYSPPKEIFNAGWYFQHKLSQVFLRTNAVIGISLAIVIIFYFFSKYYSIWLGFYSVLVSLSSFMIWSYWTEARVYSLWVFLTTIQSLILLYVLKKKIADKKIWLLLTGTHILLSFTIIFSIVQIISASFILWLFFDKNWKKYILLSVLPVLICLNYYINAPRYKFWFAENPLNLIYASIPKDRFLIIFLFLIYLLISCFMIVLSRKKKYTEKIMHFFLDKKALIETGGYYIFSNIILIGCLIVLYIFTVNQVSAKTGGFQVSNRYFICLAPIGIIATTLFSYYLFKISNNKIFKGIVLLILLGLLLIRFYRTFELVGLPKVLL